MNALVGAGEAKAGPNVIDIRGRAMTALEERLGKLEAAHGAVISAAYDNQSGMAVIHRAVLCMLEPQDFDSFVQMLGTDAAEILRVDSLNLLMEGEAPQGMRLPADSALTFVPEGTIAALRKAGRRSPRGDDIILRAAAQPYLELHGNTRGPIRSEAILPLDLGDDRLPAALLLGSCERVRFAPSQGTDLLRFFSQVFRLVLLGWLR